MIAAGLIALVAFVTWLRLSGKLASHSPSYVLDIRGQQWSFLNLYDRYRAICVQVVWLTAVSIAAAVYTHNGMALWLLFCALAVNLLLQACLLFWYEGSVHGFPYTARKYAAVLVMSLALPLYFLLGVAVLVARL